MYIEARWDNHERRFVGDRYTMWGNGYHLGVCMVIEPSESSIDMIVDYWCAAYSRYSWEYDFLFLPKKLFDRTAALVGDLEKSTYGGGSEWIKTPRSTVKKVLGGIINLPEQVIENLTVEQLKRFVSDQLLQPKNVNY